jgi:copper(I)-binding protein
MFRKGVLVTFRNAFWFFLALCAPVVAHAHEYKVGELQIGHPYTRSTPPGAVTAAAYLSVENKGRTADRLLRAASPVAGLVELHSMSMDGNIMRMRAVPTVEVAPGAAVKFAPGSLHVMLQDLKRPLKKGERIPLTLTFAHAGEVKVELAVEDAAAGSGRGDHDSDHGAHGMQQQK